MTGAVGGTENDERRCGAVTRPKIGKKTVWTLKSHCSDSAWQGWIA